MARSSDYENPFNRSRSYPNRCSRNGITQSKTMSREATRNQINDILAREKKRLGLDRAATDEQLVYKKAEDIAETVIAQAKQVFVASTAKGPYDREAMKVLLQKMFVHKFMNTLSREEMAFLLSVMHSEECISAVET